MSTNARASTRRMPGGWYVGVIRDGKTVVCECPHAHTNRDQGFGGGRYPYRFAAWECAAAYLRDGRWPTEVA